VGYGCFICFSWCDIVNIKRSQKLKALLCLACGASLPSSGICEYCGTAHESDGTLLVEYYARCPMCRRNDQVKKVSLIAPQEAILLKLPTLPSAPQEPVYASTNSNNLSLALLFTVVFLGSLVGCFVIDWGFAIVAVLMGLLTFLLWRVYLKEPEEIKTANNDMKNKYNVGLNRYKEALEKYEHSYYCYRDGSVFIYKSKT
jgi:hypothetical protein